MPVAPDLVRSASVGAGQTPGAVVEITMANPARRNALGGQMLEQLGAHLASAEASRARAVIIRAEPGSRTWSAGYDIEALPVDGSDPLTWTNPLEGLLHQVRAAPFPVIAAVEGGVWGGACELVMTCDIVVAVAGSTLAITPARLGVPYNTAGVAHFLGALPLNVAKEMFFTADPITVEEAAGYGVVNRIVPDAEALTEVSRAIGETIATRAPLAIAAIKAEMAALTDARSLTSDDFERLTALRRAAWRSADYQEGIRAFTEKRPPMFRGR
jgi:methylmalonyl-CoA decarboxylase